MQGRMQKKFSSQLVYLAIMHVARLDCMLPGVQVTMSWSGIFSVFKDCDPLL